MLLVRSVHLQRLAPPLPLDRERLQERRQRSQRPAIHCVLHDVRGEKREAQHATDAGAADPFGLGKLCEGATLTVLQHPLPAVRKREGLDQAPSGCACEVGTISLSSGETYAFGCRPVHPKSDEERTCNFGGEVLLIARQRDIVGCQ
jgi:hypothetical protein